MRAYPINLRHHCCRHLLEKSSHQVLQECSSCFSYQSQSRLSVIFTYLVILQVSVSIYNPTDIDTDVARDNEADVSWLLGEDKDHPPEYYLNQEDEFDESELDEDYSDGSILLLDFIEERFNQKGPYSLDPSSRAVGSLT
jgi:hypothetical protein